MVVWITGLSGSGKTTLCEAIWTRLKKSLPELVIVDGDIVRQTFGGDLGYKETDRVRQISRIQALASMMAKQGLVVLVAALYANDDLLAWNRNNLNGYFEIYLDASLDLVRSRDPKGLYAKADSGRMPDVVGIDIPWHAPKSPNLRIEASNEVSAEQLADLVIKAIPRLEAAAAKP